MDFWAKDAKNGGIQKAPSCLNKARFLIRRIAEHKNRIGKGGYQSFLYKHALENKHTIDYEGIETLDKANSDHKLLLKEILCFNKLKPTFYAAFSAAPIP